MTLQDKPYNRKQTMQGQPQASKPWSPFVQHFPRRLLEIPVNQAECRESTLLKQRAQHSGLLNYLSYRPGEKEFATESHKWIWVCLSQACFSPFCCIPSLAPLQHEDQLLVRREQRLRNAKKGCVSKFIFETGSGSWLRYLQISPQQYFFVVHGRLRVFFQHSITRTLQIHQEFP